MALRILSKLRKELYNVSAIESFEDTIHINHTEKDDNEAILKFLEISKTLRDKSEEEIIDYFVKALSSNRILAIKALFFIRDKVSGFGERRVFKVIINYLALNESEVLIKHLHLIDKYGRWDDYYALFYTPLENEVIKIFKNQLFIDLKSKSPSTLGKWLKSENTSSKDSKKLASRTRNLLGYTSQEYRLVLTSLRKKIDIIERKLSLRDFRSIDYKKLSLNTCLKYKSSFVKNDKYRYIKHIKTYKKNENNKAYISKPGVINQTPFNIIELIMNTNKTINEDLISIYNKLWNIVCKNYETYFEDTYVIMAISTKNKESKSLAYKVAISTALLCNQLNSNIYKNYYMYFKTQPRFGKVKGSEIVGQVCEMNFLELSASSNIESALDLLLFTSIKKELSNSKMPKNVLVISDLDLEKKYNGSNNIQLIKNKWALSGYIVPKLKFWQMEDNSIDKGISKDVYSNIFAKGYSKDILESLLKEEIITSEDLILKSLENNRYDDIC